MSSSRFMCRRARPGPNRRHQDRNWKVYCALASIAAIEGGAKTRTARRLARERKGPGAEPAPLRLCAFVRSRALFRQQDGDCGAPPGPAFQLERAAVKLRQLLG